MEIFITLEEVVVDNEIYDNMILIWQTETKYIFEFSYRIITYTRHLYQCWCVGRHVVLKCLNIVLCGHNMCIIRWGLNTNRADRWITWVTVEVQNYIR